MLGGTPNASITSRESWCIYFIDTPNFLPNFFSQNELYGKTLILFTHTIKSLANKKTLKQNYCITIVPPALCNENVYANRNVD